MARNEDVDTAIWEDEDFDGLSDDAAFLYLWSFTNERCNMAGIYRVKARSILEGRMTPARREAALTELSEKRFVYYVDGWLWVRSRVKRLRTKGHTMAISVVRAVERVPRGHPLLAAFLTEYLENTWVSRWLTEAEFENPSITHREPIDGLLGKGIGNRTGSRRDGESEGKGRSTTLDPTQLPVDADPRLAEVARRCHPILQRVAEARGGRPATLLATYRACESFPNKPHAQVAGEVEHWTVHGNGRKRPAKDIVARFRNFLDSSADEVRVTSSPSKYAAIQARADTRVRTAAEGVSAA